MMYQQQKCLIGLGLGAVVLLSLACAPEPGLVTAGSDSSDTRPQLPGLPETSGSETGETGTSTADAGDGSTTDDPTTDGWETTSGDPETTDDTEPSESTETTEDTTSDTDTQTTAVESETGTTTEEGPPFGNCLPDPEAEPDPFADCVELFDPAPEVSFGHDQMPDIVLGSPEGKGMQAGSMDVAALGCGGQIILFFDEPGIVDGPGVDFIVFENPFATGDTTFTEPAVVAVSDDLIHFYAFDCETDGSGTWPPTGCAGVEPVHADSMNGIDPTNHQLAGGDGFDLADVGLSYARYVRLVDRTQEFYGNTTWCAGAAGGFDLDALVSVHHQ